MMEHARQRRIETAMLTAYAFHQPAALEEMREPDSALTEEEIETAKQKMLYLRLATMNRLPNGDPRPNS